MKLQVKDMDIATGDLHVVILNQKDAQELDLHHLDRLVIKKNSRKTTAVLDIAESRKAVPPGKIGFFEEVLDALKAKNGDTVKIDIADKPASTVFIRKKLDGEKLNANELRVIVQDIVDSKLTDVELASFVIASYIRGMNMKEVAAMTQAMVETGYQLKFNKHPIVDLHSIGGVPGNRTTMIMVPILIAAGCIIPKTSSRAITSPAGTADTMEVLCSVSHTAKKLKKIIKDVGGFIIWGGAVNLAPADDKIIRVEHPLSIDAEGQMLASIMAKKASVGATHLLMEIPIGKEAKVPNMRKAKHLRRHFSELGRLLKMKVLTVITSGNQPIGRGIGPVLEARDVIWALKNHEKAPKDLVDKSLVLTGELLEFVGRAKKGKGKEMARKLLTTGAAYKAMEKMVKAQGGKMPDPDKLTPAKHAYALKSNKTGIMHCISNKTVAKAARLAGAPIDPDAGIYIHKHCGEQIKKGQTIFTVYSRSKHKLNAAKQIIKKLDGIDIKTSYKH